MQFNNDVILCNPVTFSNWVKESDLQAERLRGQPQAFWQDIVKPGCDIYGDHLPVASKVNVGEKCVGIIPVKGMITKGLPSIFKAFGAVDVDELCAQIKDMDEDEECDCLALSFDSPGGTVGGVPECADAIFNIAKKKKVYGVIDGQCCSAAFWLASQCSALISTKSSDIGSIGVYCAYPDYSQAFEREGIKIDMFKSGPLKAAGYPGTSLSDAQRANIQQGIDSIYAMFTGDVKRNRKSIKDDSMQGQSFLAEDACNRGLCDGIGNLTTLLDVF